MCDLIALEELMTLKLDELVLNYSFLQTAVYEIGLKGETQENKQCIYEFKTKYISLSGDIVLLSRSIVATWIPFAKQCQDKTLSQRLLANLTKIDVLAGKLRLVKNSKNYKDEDYDEEGKVMEAAKIVLANTRDALEAMDMLKVMMGDALNDCLYVELQI